METDDKDMQELERRLLGKVPEEEGGESNAISGSNNNRSGVLHTAMTSINSNKDYRQELKTGYFTSQMKQMQMVLAIDECRECGVDQTLVIDLLIAQKAGEKGGLLQSIFNALTHTTQNHNINGNQGSRWWNKGEPRNPDERQ